MRRPAVTRVTARSGALLTAADVGDDHTARWRRDAGELGAAVAAFRRGAVDVAPVVPDLDVRLQRLATRASRLDDELRAVATAFLAADAPPDTVVGMSALELDHLLGGPWRRRDVTAELDELAAILGDRHRDARERSEAVRAILAQLPREAWLALAEADPVLVGNTDGIPVELRYVANRIAMTRALAQAEAARAAAGAEVDERLQGRIDNLRRLLHTSYPHLVPGQGEPELRMRQVLLFDPAGDGRAAEVFGDLATATSVATFVPGITNRLDNLQNTSGMAERLYGAASELGDGGVATIAWLGYDTPELLDAPSRLRADEWARALADFQAALPVSLGNSRARTTVVAHSYGSLLAGVAIREEGLRADAIAVIGSPGMNVGHASQLGLPDDVPLYAGRAHRDLVSLSQGHGTDPSKPWFGAIPFATGDISGHSAYTDADSTSLANLANIVLGNDHAVSRDGWDLEDLVSTPAKVVTVVTFPLIGGVIAGYEVVDELVIGVRDATATVREVALDARDLVGGAVSAVDEAWDGVVDLAGDVTSEAGRLAGDAWDGTVEQAGTVVGGIWSRTPWG